MIKHKILYNTILSKFALKWIHIFKNLLKHDIILLDIIYIKLKYMLYIIMFKMSDIYFNADISISNKYIQKGVKYLGTYIKTFLKRKSFSSIKKLKYFYWIIVVKRKNLFMTFLNLEGNVLFKTNIGSSGFKKRVKFTGHAINKTSHKFGKKIIRYIKKYQKIINSKIIKSSKLKDLSLYIKAKLQKRKIHFLKKNDKKLVKFDKAVLKRKIKLINKVNKFVIKKNSYKFIFYKNRKIKVYWFQYPFIFKKNNKILVLEADEYFQKIYFKLAGVKLQQEKSNYQKKTTILECSNIFKQILKRKKYLYIKKFRNYAFYKYRKWLKKKRARITIQLMSELSYWAIRFVWYGMSKLNKQYNLKKYINKLEDRIHISHSKGLRIKKKKRI